MDWTPEAIEALRGFWSEGHSTAEIGRRMGISKNAVVGKAHRLNLSARPSPIRRDAAAPQAVTPPHPVTVAAPAAQPEAVQPAQAQHAAAQYAPAQPPAPAAQPMYALPASAQPAATLPAVAAPAAPARVPAPAASPARPAVPLARKPTPIPLPNAVVRPFPRSSSRTCCWPIGEPGTPGFRFCTTDALGTKPYCAEHAALAYVKVRDRREDAA
ncbi:MAG: GcrA cell cycle regulator [Roseomonas sp.]|nr:GcrA cell cycle regulator [Roseomonas sp.]